MNNFKRIPTIQKRFFQIIKSTKNPSLEWLEIDCKSQHEMYQLLNSNEPLRKAFDNAISMVPELHTARTEMNDLLSKKGFMSKSNPNVIDSKFQEEAMNDTELIKMRKQMHELLIKYGFLVPSHSDSETQEPLNLFGPQGQRAAIIQGSVPPRRIGMQTMLKKDYDQMVMEHKGILGRLRYRFKIFFNKWLY